MPLKIPAIPSPSVPIMDPKNPAVWTTVWYDYLRALDQAMREAQSNITGNQTNIATILDDLNVASTQNVAWTPTLTFATPGTLALTYTTRVGKLFKLGWLVLAKFNILTATFNKGTAAGDLQITGLPIAAVSDGGVPFRSGVTHWHTITKASFTDVMAVVNGSTINFDISGSAQTTTPTVQAGDVPTGAQTMDLAGTVIYATAA